MDISLKERTTYTLTLDEDAYDLLYTTIVIARDAIKGELLHAKSLDHAERLDQLAELLNHLPYPPSHY